MNSTETTQNDSNPYKEAFFREKEARQQAEKALDEKTREIYNSMMIMEKQYDELLIQKKQLEQTQSQLIQSEKMSSLGQLSAGVAHEINNPISFILLNLDTFLEYTDTLMQLTDMYETFENNPDNIQLQKIQAYKDTQDIEFIKEDVKKIYDDSKDGLNRVKDIVHSLKSFSRADDGELAECDINDCLKNTLKVIWNELKHKARVTESYCDIATVSGNTNQLSQVFMNLLVNASHAVEDCERNGEIIISTFQEQDSIVVSIKDNGNGIPEEVQHKIFDPFFTTKPVDIGTGLGLSISYGIIEKHSGSLVFSSVQNQGTEFRISLPISEKNI